jgi:hypothetical protein
MIRRKMAALAASIIALGVPASASAVTQCQGTVLRIFAGDGGTVYVFLKPRLDNAPAGTPATAEGPAGVLLPNDPNRDTILSMAMTAQAQRREVIMRFTADNVSCWSAVARFDFVGMYLEP